MHTKMQRKHEKRKRKSKDSRSQTFWVNAPLPTVRILEALHVLLIASLTEIAVMTQVFAQHLLWPCGPYLKTAALEKAVLKHKMFS